LKLFTFGHYNNICEVGLLYILGFTSSHIVSKFPRQWSRLRNDYLADIGKKEHVFKDISKGSSRAKFEHATAYILLISANYGRDDEVGIGETVPDGTVKTNNVRTDGTVKANNVRILPYDNMAQIFEEYVTSSKVNKEEGKK
jgi:hypothetical protein